MHVIAAKAVAFGEALRPEFAAYARQIVRNAGVLAEGLAGGGLRLVSGGTDTHLILVDATPLGLTGQAAETALSLAGITVNKNAIPFDPQPPTVTSGVRLGSPALTTRGFQEAEMAEVARLIVQVLTNPDSEAVQEKVRKRVAELCQAFPIYRDLLEK
jgi:glycine hydroxymethyltransferase